MGLPETVKIEKVSLTCDGNVVTAKADWGIGPKEVAVLLAVRFIVDTLPDNAVWFWALNRKSQGQPSEITMAETAGLTDIIAGGGGSTLTKVGQFCAAEDFTFPYPVILLRPSQIMVEGTTGITCGAYLYYLVERVSDEDLAKLMVKDHG